MGRIHSLRPRKPSPPPDRKLALEKLRVRKEMRSIDYEEDTQNIEAEAKARVEQKSDPPKSAKLAVSLVRPIVVVLNVLPPWGRVPVLLALIGVGTLYLGFSNGWW
jgi:hypothetical protein